MSPEVLEQDEKAQPPIETVWYFEWLTKNKTPPAQHCLKSIISGKEKEDGDQKW